MNTPVTCFTALINIAEDEQCEELEEYLRKKGSDIVTSNDTELLPRLQTIIDKCGVVFQHKDLSQQEVDGFFYSVVSLFHIVSFDETKDVVDSFCSKIVESGIPENASQRLRLLGLMFCHFPVKDPLRFVAMCHRVKLAGLTGQTSSLVIDMGTLRQWTALWQIDDEQKRKLYLLLWEAHKKSKDKSLSSQILTELLRTFGDKDAKEALVYAEQLIVAVIADPCCFVFDNVLKLAPIAALENQKVHQLLKIFINQKLSTFIKFYEANKQFVDDLGLDYDFCVTKMRRLTLTSLAVQNQEIPFDTLKSELNLPQDELETFILESISLKLVEARINQVSKTLIVTNSIHRTFEKEQWQLLHDRLLSWQQSVQSLKSSLKAIKT